MLNLRMANLFNNNSITVVLSYTNIIAFDSEEHLCLAKNQYQNDRFIELYKSNYA